MTEKEIVQALRCCAEGDCKDCAMHEDKQRCQENLLDKAAEAIERLTAENAALREKQLLLRQPAADVAEVVHARWEEADWHEYDAQSGETIRFPKAAIVCSDCRNAFKKDALWKRNSCPNCGAKMDGAAE